MRVLRLGNSEDVSGVVAESERAYSIAASVLEQVSGEPVETVVRPIWPEAELPELVDRWLERYEPDMVFLKVTWYWYGYESVPVRVERKLGAVGTPIARLGLKAAENRRLARNPFFKAGRRFAHRAIGGDSPFEPAVVVERMEAVIRRVVAHEHVGLVVKGTGDGRRDEAALEGHFEQFTRKREFVEGSIERLCKQLHVVYVGTGAPKSRDDRDFEGGDGVHKGARGHRAVGLQEGEALVLGWRTMRGERSP